MSGLAQTNHRQKRLFLLGMFSLFIANYWPVADLAQHELLLARMFQQLLITLSATPLLLMALPKTSIVLLTKPRFLDFPLKHLTRPVPSVLIFTTTTILAMTPAIAGFDMSSVAAQQLVHLSLLIAALLIWIPILRILPGMKQLSTVGRLAFLFVLSLLPNIPAIVLIFAKRPLYPTYSHSALGISAVADQQLTGAAAKVLSLAVFWGVAISVLLRADKDEALGLDPDPITWDDVQREFDREAKRSPRV
ncbi:MAG: hypothetical protein EPN30_05725 [Actinomycetota bacterium]|nr:MAG: hypothetical protein EPN30_05725 [Actinomycetota bacterium]